MMIESASLLCDFSCPVHVIFKIIVRRRGPGRIITRNWYLCHNSVGGCRKSCNANRTNSIWRVRVDGWCGTARRVLQSAKNIKDSNIRPVSGIRGYIEGLRTVVAGINIQCGAQHATLTS